MMRRRLLLSVLLTSLAATGCLFKNQRNSIAKPTPPLPSPLAKAQPPKPVLPVAAPTPSPATTAANTLPDESEYKAVPIPAPPQPVAEIIPTAARSAEPSADTSDDEKKRLLERLREKRDERREERAKDAPKLPSATTPKDAPPKAAAAPADGLTVAKQVYALAYAKYEKLNDYEVHMVRREVVGGKETPTEEIQFQYRKQPFSVYMKNIGENGKGREVLYVEGKFDGLMHVVTGQGDNRLIGAGFKTSLRPDSSMATAKSRHKITEAGAGNMLVKLDKAIKSAEAGRSAIKSLGTVQRKDQPTPVDGIEIPIAAGDDSTLPKGGKWTLYFDLKSDSPGYGNLAVQVTTDEKDREVEYYCFTNWKVPANLTDADFHPDRLGAKKK
ncbi:DUF1571 domain-containing protein [Limnoglobus roseus]|uniref:DUF1571 domain-containing protein n=1 Tax=Limnoglobus roseus TaxID=2598579 RepID=A0A5C1A8J4_9BACT|nr:DUF1571 domain-containing protein [Limnoglobus roseus]QEL14513.1 hypothetical protein PX52LOC_01403 [Limnoglobus roseus]